MPDSSPASSGGVSSGAVLHDEQVRLRALGDLAPVVAQHASNAPRRNASCIASALFSRLFDLISGLTEPGWLRTTGTSDDLHAAARRPPAASGRQRLHDDDERRRRAARRGRRLISPTPRVTSSRTYASATVRFSWSRVERGDRLAQARREVLVRHRHSQRDHLGRRPQPPAGGGRTGTVRRRRCGRPRRRPRRRESRGRTPR